jgi:hypothetical protein
MANQPTPSLGASAEGVSRGRAKKNYLLITAFYFYFYYAIDPYRPQNNGITSLCLGWQCCRHAGDMLARQPNVSTFGRPQK